MFSSLWFLATPTCHNALRTKMSPACTNLTDYDPWYLLYSTGLAADLLAHRMGKGTARMMPARKDFVRICRSDLTLDAMNSKHVEKSKQI